MTILHTHIGISLQMNMNCMVPKDVMVLTSSRVLTFLIGVKYITCASLSNPAEEHEREYYKPYKVESKMDHTSVLICNTYINRIIGKEHKNWSWSSIDINNSSNN